MAVTIAIWYLVEMYTSLPIWLNWFVVAIGIAAAILFAVTWWASVNDNDQDQVYTMVWCGLGTLAATFIVIIFWITTENDTEKIVAASLVLFTVATVATTVIILTASTVGWIIYKARRKGTR